MVSIEIGETVVIFFVAICTALICGFLFERLICHKKNDQKNKTVKYGQAVYISLGLLIIFFGVAKIVAILFGFSSDLGMLLDHWAGVLPVLSLYVCVFLLAVYKFKLSLSYALTNSLIFVLGMLLFLLLIFMMFTMGGIAGVVYRLLKVPY